MRQVTRKGLITVAAAGGVIALGGGYAHADSGARGAAANSPGVLSGNNVQVPVHIPVNACGNTVNVVGVLNPAFGNKCANVSDHGHGGKGGNSGHGTGGSHGTPPRGGSHGDGYGGDGPDTAPPRGGAHGSGSNGGSHAGGGTGGSPGIGSGNTVEIPIDIPVNACGNTVSVIGLLNPAFGNDCENASPVPATPGPAKPVQPTAPTPPVTRTVPPTPSVPNAPEPQVAAPPVHTDELAHTGAGGLGTAIPVGAGLLLAGGVLYRRARSRSRTAA
ncbi:chaplin [Streptomyces sp. NBC_01317]|uniref:chaplin n=1 Tax=Streptomyces sp. NBC_01317 TaxID=2903822 RepID=UPI002E10E8B2